MNDLDRLKELFREAQSRPAKFQILPEPGGLWCSVCLFIPETDRPPGWDGEPMTILNGYLVCRTHSRYVADENTDSPLARYFEDRVVAAENNQQAKWAQTGNRGLAPRKDT